MAKICLDRFTQYIRNLDTLFKASTICYLDIWGESKPIDFLFKTESGEPFISAGDLQTIKGREKMGKSAAGVILVGAALSGEFLGVEAQHEQTKVLWIDTEQSEATLRARVQQTLRMAGANDESLRVLSLRGFEPSERLKITLDAVADWLPDFVFLDGVVDLCEDFNDNTKSMRVVERLLKATKDYNCAIAGVVHVNKKDNEARGHLGTVLQQKSAEVYEVVKSDEIATIRQSLSRFASVSPIRFKFGDNFTIEAIEADAMRKEQDERFRTLLAERKALKYNELVKAYSKLYDCKERTAKGHISKAVTRGTLNKENGVYTYLFPLYDDCTDEDDII